VPKRDSERRSFNSDKAAKARSLLGVGSLEQALLLAEQAWAEDENSADTHSLVASILDHRGEWQASLAHLRRAHELMPDGPQARLNLAMALLRKERPVSKGAAMRFMCRYASRVQRGR